MLSVVAIVEPTKIGARHLVVGVSVEVPFKASMICVGRGLFSC